jgi:hypothetical protein
VSAKEGETRREIDLGWLQPDDLVTFAVFNEVGEDFTAFFSATSNGRPFGETREGSLGASLQRPVEKIVFVRTFTADGDEVGEVGCDLPGKVDEALPYARLAASEDDSGRFSPKRWPDVAISIATIFAWAVAVVGCLLVFPLVVFEGCRHARGLIPLVGALAGAVALIVVLPVSSTGDGVLVVGAVGFLVATVWHCAWGTSKRASIGASAAAEPR